MPCQNTVNFINKSNTHSFKTNSLSQIQTKADQVIRQLQASIQGSQPPPTPVGVNKAHASAAYSIILCGTLRMFEFFSGQFLGQCVPCLLQMKQTMRTAITGGPSNTVIPSTSPQQTKGAKTYPSGLWIWVRFRVPIC